MSGNRSSDDLLEDERPGDSGFESWARDATSEHVDEFEIDGVVAHSSDPPVRRALAHLRGCPLCLERLSAGIEQAVLEESDRMQGAAVDWNPLRRFLAHEEPVIRAAAARSIAAHRIDAPAILDDLRRLESDADEFVQRTTASVLSQRSVTAATPIDRSRTLRSMIANAIDAFTAGVLQPTEVLGAPLDRTAGRGSRTPPRERREVASPDKRLSVAIAPHDHGAELTFSTSDKTLAGATVQFALVPVRIGAPGEIVVQVTLEKRGARWEADWQSDAIREPARLEIRKVVPRRRE